MNRVLIIAKYLLLLELYFLLCQVGCRNSDEYKPFDFQNHRGINTGFKIYMPGWKEECFYESLVNGGRFEVTYLVFGHKEVDFYIYENSQVLLIDSKSQRGSYLLRNATEGTYAVCFHNIYNAFSSVVVYLLMVTYESVETHTTLEDLGELTRTMNNLTISLARIQDLTRDVWSAQRYIGLNILRDTNHLQANEDYVFKWSLAQCLITVAAAFIQVYSIRWLFNPASVKSKQGTLRA